MSYIDYASRPRSRAAAYEDEDPFSDRSAAGNGGHQPAMPSNAGGAHAASYDYAEQGQAAAPYSGQQQQQYSQHHAPQPGHDFQIEHVHTDGEFDSRGNEWRGADAQASAQQEPFFDPTFEDFTHEAPLEMPFFDHVVQDYGSFGTFQKLRLTFRQTVSFLLTLGALGLILVASFAWYLNPFAKKPPRARADREYERRVTGERGSGRVQYYAEVSKHTLFLLSATPPLTLSDSL